MEKLGLNISEIYYDESIPGYPAMPLTAEMAKKIKGYSVVKSVEPKDSAVFLPGVMSRKKQIIPMLTALWG